MTACDKTGCPQSAHSQLFWVTWARGYPRTDATKLHGFVGLNLCPGHIQTFDPDTIFTHEFWDAVDQSLLAMGKAPVDRSHFEYYFRSIN